jgi:hypothetical protein
MTERFLPPADAVKLFAMTAQLIEADLDQIENDFALDLGRAKAAQEKSDEGYYPQFDEDVRREASEMSRYYEVFYCLEKSIRKLISDTLSADAGSNWWSSTRILPTLQQDVAKRMQREVDSAVTVRSGEPLDYTTFGELGEIIKSNWELFGAIFNSQRAVEKVIANLNTLRGPIAHCSPLAEDEILRLQLSMRDWFRIMG